MKEKNINGKTYKLPGSLTPFQEDMYVHLINWKWKNISTDFGYYNFRGSQIKYDAIIPDSDKKKFPLIYPSILEDLIQHQNTPKLKFKLHQHFHHMASSQAANINLFLPILLNSRADQILKLLKPDFKSLAISELYKGFRIEYWDGSSDKEAGLLKDHSALSGTDSDIAIAYYNHDDELCLWLIEHKLTEKEFTECGGYKSPGNTTKNNCEKPFSDILQDKSLCYHVYSRNREYWNITNENKAFFANAPSYPTCPFKGGMNQLWRNQLMGLALEKSGEFKQVYFSVVKHHDNLALNGTITQYKNLINHHPKFSVFDSREVVNVASKLNDSVLNEWIEWYKGLYKL